MDYQQPPAIIEKVQNSALDCGYLRNAKLGNIRYIFDIDLQEAKRLFPPASGLERIATLQNTYMGSTSSFALYRYKESSNLWDIAVEYNKSTGKPIILRYSKGKIHYLEDKDVHIPEQHDIVFHFNKSAFGINGDFNLDELRHYISNAYYSCNAGERWLLEAEFNKNNTVKEMQKKPEPKKIRPKIKKQSFQGKRMFMPQKTIRW